MEYYVQTKSTKCGKHHTRVIAENIPLYSTFQNCFATKYSSGTQQVILSPAVPIASADVYNYTTTVRGHLHFNDITEATH